MKKYWLMKSEPETYSIDDLRRDGTAPWDGVRNYQARNNMKAMKTGDEILFYHSSADPAGVAGLARVSREAYPDPTQFDKKSAYYEPRATKDKPVWMMVEIEFVKKFPRLIPLGELKNRKDLHGMVLLKKGSRLSVQPVAERHFSLIMTNDK